MRKVEKLIEVNAPVEFVFDQFTSLNLFPSWMQGVRDVRLLPSRRTRWLVDAPDGTLVEWEAETTVYEANRRLSWESVNGAVATEGVAVFRATDPDTTLVRLALGYGMPPWLSDSAVAHIFAENLGQRLEEDLAHFGQLVEREFALVSRHREEQKMPAPAVAPEAALPESESNVVHFEPLSRYQRSGRVIRQARPLGPDSAGAESPAGEPRPAPLPIIIDTRRPRDEQRLEYAGTGRTAAISGSRGIRLHPATLFILVAALLVFVVGATWLLMRRTPPDAEAVNVSTAASPRVSPRPSPRSAPPDQSEGAAAQATATPVNGVSPTPASSPEATPSVREERADAAAETSNYEAAIRSMINGWLAATRAKDVDRQMNFYAPLVERYYLQTGVPREAVRADKARRFADADAIRLSTSEPEITLQQDGRTASVRFRKQYE